MRIVLEKADLIKIIGRYLDAELDPSRVVVRTDPFEVEVTDIPLSAPEAAPSADEAPMEEAEEPIPALQRADPDATTEMPSFADPAQFLQVSKTLEAELDARNPALVAQRQRFTNDTSEQYVSEDMEDYD